MNESDNPLGDDNFSEELLALLLAEEGFELTPAGDAIPRRDEVIPPPLSFAQQRLWFLDQLQPGNPAYNFASAVRLRGPLHEDALAQSLGEIVRRHQVLRTTFTTIDEQPVQVIHPWPEDQAAWPIPVIDLEQREGQEARARQLIQEEARYPFNLAEGPLLRARLLRLAEADHILLLTFHHISFDGWSEDIFFRELGLLYSGLTTGRAATLPPLPLHYADFAGWQRDWLKGELFETQLAYWRQQLGGHLPLLRLPTDHPHPPIQTFQGATQTSRLPRELVEALKTLSQQAGVTLFITLLAAFKALLYRYTGQADILVGTPVANRNRSELESLIGFFVNTLVLRTNLAGNPTGRELLERLRTVALNAYAHQDLPFEQLVEVLQPERDLSHQPLFQVMFGLQTRSTPISTLGDLSLTPVEVENNTAQFDLSLFVEERGLDLITAWEYNTDLFEAETITRLAGHWQNLLVSLVAHPEKRLSDFSLLAGPEAQQLLHLWNNTALAYPHDRCLHHLFEAQVEKTPEAIAVVFEEHSLTYQELDRQANRLAGYLQTLGVGPETLVGIAVERSLEMVVGLLAILKAGGAYLPLDPAYPPARLAFTLADAGVSLLLTQAALVSHLPQLPQLRLISLDGAEAAWSVAPDQLPAPAITPAHLAYVIYTSGSTGQPKGVQIPHQAVVNFLTSMARQPGLTAQDTLLAVTTLSFDIAGLELFLPLTVGAKIVIAGREVIADGPALARQLAESGATLMQATPATWQLLLASGWQNSTGITILCGGEALPRPLADQLLALSPAVWNLYGPTETTIWSTASPVEPAAGPVSIGRPIANTEIYILDASLQPVPVGVAGELYIGGEGLARGYLRLPALTAEKFIPHPFSPRPGQRLYRTGDLARYRPDGRLEILGRVDHQVKVRGFRIELEEIEAALNRHAGVQQAVVTASNIAGADHDRRLVAYFTPTSTPPPAPEDLRAYLAEMLPDYMLPAIFETLDNLPLTPNGKVDRNALPAPTTQPRPATQRYLAPRDPLELQLARIWETILEVRPVGIKDNFFESGGHSLLAVRLMAQIKKRFDQDIPLAALFQHPTVEHLARVLRRQSARLYHAPLVEIQRRGSNPPFFCVHPADGTVLSYIHLARHLGSQQPFYGLQVVTPNPETGGQVEEMASRYIQAIQTVQPQGPYLLGGWSLGGVIALEMAQQLQQSGHEVALLALIDSWAPPNPALAEAGTLTEAEVNTHLLAEFLADLRGRFASDLPSLPGNFSQLNQEEQLYHVIEQAKMLETVLPEGGLAQLHHLLKIFQSNVRAVQRYHARPYSGRVALFQAGEELAGQDEGFDPTLGWARWTTQPIDIHIIPGDHYTILAEPHVQTLAGRLRQGLNKASGLFFSS